MPNAAFLANTAYLKNHIRTVENWPEAGVMFRDITPLLQDKKYFRILVDLFVHRYINADIDYVAGMDARGFIIGAVIAYELNIGFIPIRKKGKLPFQTIAEPYALEYGTDEVEIHTDACKKGDRVLLIDDLIATGGTLLAGYQLLTRLGAEVVELAGIIDLVDLGGSAKIREQGLSLFTLCEFNGK